MPNLNTRHKHFVGIDPSPTGTGIAVLSCYSGVWERSTHRITPPGLTDCARLDYIFKEARKFIEECTVHDEDGSLVRGETLFVCIEGPATKSTNQADKQGEVRGVLKLALLYATQAVPIVVAPLSLKKFATGHGHASKEKVEGAMKALDWKADSMDEYDAAALAECARALHCSRGLPLTRNQLEALRGIYGKIKTTPPTTGGINI